MVQLRPRASRTPVSAEAMVDEGQPASEEAAEHGLLLGQPSSGAAAEPLEEDEEGDDEFDDEAPEELTFASAQAEAREEERRVRESVRRFGARGRRRALPAPTGRSSRAHLSPFLQGQNSPEGEAEATRGAVHRTEGQREEGVCVLKRLCPG